MSQKQVPPPSTPYGPPILLEASKKAMAAAEAEATKNNWGVAIAIVDSGNLVGAYLDEASFRDRRARAIGPRKADAL